MKKLLLIMAIIATTFTVSNAQFDIENLTGGARIGYAKPLGNFSDYAKGGFTYDIVVGYKLTEQLSVGIEYGSTVTAAIDTTGGGLFDLTFYGLNNYLLKGTYKFMDNEDFSPYASIGLGLARVAEPDVTFNGVTTTGAKKIGFGANAELGIVFRGFNLAYAFNLGGNSPEAKINNGDNLKVNYHSFLVGYIYNF